MKRKSKKYLSSSTLGLCLGLCFGLSLALLSISGCGSSDRFSDPKSDTFDATILGGKVETVKSTELKIFAAGGDLPQLSSKVDQKVVDKFRVFMLRNIPIPSPTSQSEAAKLKLNELISSMARIVRDSDSQAKIERTIMNDAAVNGGYSSLYRILMSYPTPVMQLDLAVFALSWKKLERLVNELDAEHLKGF